MNPVEEVARVLAEALALPGHGELIVTIMHGLS